jgi:uncharacterized protein DUF6946
MRCEYCGATTSKDKNIDRSCCRSDLRSTPLALSATNRAMHSVDEWFQACPPKGGARAWKDGYSAKESAKAWFRSGELSVPSELAALMDSAAEFSGFRLGTASPEVCTRLDDFKQGRNADVIVSGLAGGRRTIIAVEAKAAEDFGPQIGARLLSAIAHTKVPSRIDALAEAVFGRRVTTVDPHLAGLRYQLLHALAGAVIEAKRRNADQALLAIHYFPNTRRPVSETFDDFSLFVRTLAPEISPEPGKAIRVMVRGSETVPPDMPVYVGWATAPAATK